MVSISDKTIIVDYNSGNLRSAANMLAFLNVPFEISSDIKTILKAGRIIFPGQGHFAQAVNNLKNKGLDEAIKECLNAGIPFLGICIGLQILFETSEEAPEAKGLGIFKGHVKKFASGRIPQIGWNKVIPAGIDKNTDNDYFYFVNSYYAEPEDKSIISTFCDYGIKFCSSIKKNNITAVQFHPEKSAQSGLKFFRNWLGEGGEK